MKVLLYHVMYQKRIVVSADSRSTIDRKFTLPGVAKIPCSIVDISVVQVSAIDMCILVAHRP